MKNPLKKIGRFARNAALIVTAPVITLLTLNSCSILKHNKKSKKELTAAVTSAPPSVAADTVTLPPGSTYGKTVMRYPDSTAKKRVPMRTVYTIDSTNPHVKTTYFSVAAKTGSNLLAKGNGGDQQLGNVQVGGSFEYGGIGNKNGVKQGASVDAIFFAGKTQGAKHDPNRPPGLTNSLFNTQGIVRLSYVAHVPVDKKKEAGKTGIDFRISPLGIQFRKENDSLTQTGAIAGVGVGAHHTVFNHVNLYAEFSANLTKNSSLGFVQFGVQFDLNKNHSTTRYGRKTSYVPAGSK